MLVYQRVYFTNTTGRLGQLQLSVDTAMEKKDAKLGLCDSTYGWKKAVNVGDLFISVISDPYQIFISVNVGDTQF
jgi:hypothetical protein